MVSLANIVGLAAVILSPGAEAFGAIGSRMVATCRTAEPLPKLFFPDHVATGRSVSAPPEREQTICVLGSMRDARIVILSAGRDAGLFEGILVRLDGGVLLKVVEARRKCSAAVPERTFKGEVLALEGRFGQIAFN